MTKTVTLGPDADDVRPPREKALQELQDMVSETTIIDNPIIVTPREKEELKDHQGTDQCGTPAT